MGLISDLLSGGKKSSHTTPNRPDSNTNAPDSTNNPYPPVGASNPLPPHSKKNGHQYDEDQSLPPGWVKQWSEEHHRYFYVDSNALNGPQSHWVHPSEMNTNHSSGRVSNFVGSSYPQDPRHHSYAQQSMYQQVPTQMNERRSDTRIQISVVSRSMMAGAGGLAGGMLLGSMLEGDHERREGYEEGYEDNGNDDGGMFGGGDDFGGDF